MQPENCPGQWKFLRERTDKGCNALKTALSVLNSIEHPIYGEDIIGFTKLLSADSFKKGKDTNGLGKRARPDNEEDSDAGKEEQDAVMDDY